MAFKINDMEFQALYGLPHLQQLMYLRGIRPYMDYASGVVGVKRGISYQSLIESCYVDSHVGYASSQLSHDQVKRGLASLERCGVISRESRRKKLILKCELATWDKSAQNKAALKPPREVALENLSENRRNKEFDRDGSSQAALGKGGKAAPPPVSGKDSLSKRAREADVVPSDFRPGGDTLQLAKTNGCVHSARPDEILKFIAYHQSRGNARCDWQAEYLHWLLKGKSYQQKVINS